MCAQLQFIDSRFQIRTTNQIEPFLHIIFIDKMRIFAFALGGEENVQVKFVKLALFGNLLDTVGDFIGQHDHSRQGCVGIILAYPVFFCALLIGIGPVVNLFFDKLAGVQSTEWRAGQIKIIGRCNGQPRFIVGIAAIIFAQILVVAVLVLFKQLFCAVLPCSEVVLIENHQIPVGSMHPLVIGFDAASRFIHTEKILK